MDCGVTDWSGGGPRQAWVVERMGRFSRVLEPGMAVLAPLLDRVKYVHNLREMPIELVNIPGVTQGSWSTSGPVVGWRFWHVMGSGRDFC